MSASASLRQQVTRVAVVIGLVFALAVALVGPALAGPTDGVPEALTSFADFERTFGGLGDLFGGGAAATAELEEGRVLRGFVAQARQLDPAITAIIERSVAEDISLVIEGVHLVPGAVAERRVETILRSMLFVDDESDHRRHFAAREMRTAHRLAQPYLDHFEEIRMLHDYMRERSDAEGVLVVDASDFETAVERCVDYVLDALLEMQRHGLGPWAATG